jgi:hypothetical protein
MKKKYKRLTIKDNLIIALAGIAAYGLLQLIMWIFG